jgi:hypothetical protein
MRAECVHVFRRIFTINSGYFIGNISWMDLATEAMTVYCEVTIQFLNLCYMIFVSMGRSMAHV